MHNGTLCLRCGSEGGNYQQFLLAVFSDFYAFSELPGVPRKCRPEVNGFLTKCNSHVIVVFRTRACPQLPCPA